MGMFDDFIITDNLDIGIPKGNYQSKDLNLGLDVYTIDNDGNIILVRTLDGEDGRFWDEGKVPNVLPSKLTGIDFHLNICGPKIYYKGKLEDWLEFILYIENGKVVKVVNTMTYPSDYKEAELGDIVWVPYEHEIKNI